MGFRVLGFRAFLDLQVFGLRASWGLGFRVYGASSYSWRYEG